MEFLSPKELYGKRDELLKNGWEPVRINFNRTSSPTGSRTVSVDF